MCGLVYHKRCAKIVYGADQTAIWSDESSGIVVGGSAAAGRPVAVLPSTIAETARADHDGQTTVMAGWRDTVLRSHIDEGDEYDGIDDEESTWPLVTTTRTISYSVWVNEENAGAMYVKMAVETQVTVCMMDGHHITEMNIHSPETSFYEFVVDERR